MFPALRLAPELDDSESDGSLVDYYEQQQGLALRLPPEDDSDSDVPGPPACSHEIHPIYSTWSATPRKSRGSRIRNKKGTAVPSKVRKVPTNTVKTTRRSQRQISLSTPIIEATRNPSQPRPLRPAHSNSPNSDTAGGGDEFVPHTPRRSVAPQQPLAHLEELILVYRQGQSGSLQITNNDVARLEPGGYLNDTLVEFGLKLWLEDLAKENRELVKQIHVFSSFFYKMLVTNEGRTGYESVRRWTNKFDLFNKKYLVVPINENLHWYLAIICHPEHTLKAPLPKKSPLTRDKTQRRPEAGQVLPSNSTWTRQTVFGSLALCMNGQAMDVDTGVGIPDFAPDAPPSEDDHDEEAEQLLTYIITLDSLGGKHATVNRVLSHYLQCEAQDKKGIPMDRSREAVGKQAHVPLQPNTFDCGIYLLHLAQTFLSDPAHYFNLIINERSKHNLSLEWKADQIKMRRRSLTERINELSVEWRKNWAEKKCQKTDRIPESSDVDFAFVNSHLSQ